MTIFEKIINSEIKSYKIFEDDIFIVILDAFPKNLGHTLIIPKIKHENVLQEENEIISKMFILAKKISLLLTNRLNTNDIKWVSNIGKNAGQVIFHTHIHLVPYYENKNKNKLLKNDFENILKILK